MKKIELLENPNIMVKNKNGLHIELIPKTKKINVVYLMYWAKRVYKEYRNHRFKFSCKGYIFDGKKFADDIMFLKGFYIYEKKTGRHRTFKPYVFGKTY